MSLYDIQNANGVAAEEMEPIPLERGLILTDQQNETISSFAWHLNEENRLLYSTTSLNIRVFYQINILMMDVTCYHIYPFFRSI